jgi:hypothetical protein
MHAPDVYAAYIRAMKCLLAAVLLISMGVPVRALEVQTPVHGLWVWKTASVLGTPRGAAALRQFCKSAGISEIYVSFAARTDGGEEGQLANLISLLHESRTRVEALISSVDADEPGAPRAKLLAHARAVLQFNARHPGARFDGIHLDIEPQQRPENKGPGNLKFLGGLVAAYRDVAALTQPAALSLNADIQMKLLKGDLEQRRTLLRSIPRVTLMLYELSGPDDVATTAEKEAKLRERDRELLDAAYQGLPNEGVAKMAIALRTPDYGALISQMLATLDEVNRANPHYLGWARHSYNDTLASP